MGGSACRDCHGLIVLSKLPDGFEKFGVGGILQSAAVEAGAQFADGGDRLAGPHLENQFSEFAQARVEFRSRVAERGVGVPHERSHSKTGDRISSLPS